MSWRCAPVAEDTPTICQLLHGNVLEALVDFHAELMMLLEVCADASESVGHLLLVDLRGWR